MNFIFEGERKNGKEFNFTINAQSVTTAIIETAMFISLDCIEWGVLHQEYDFPTDSYFTINNGNVIYMSGEFHSNER